ncbi:MAG: ribonuclease HII [Candidatus Omnitrophica bacterium]|nr:ribonuclease HII [Candidatus Omnitrophota bacterium]
MLYYERKLKKKGYNLIIGVDEAGRGPLAGPVVAAAVTLNTYRFKNQIDDSKKLTARIREKAFAEIIQKSIFGVGVVNEGVIDQVNILQATRLAMKQAIGALVRKIKSSESGRIHVIVDGNMTLDIDLPCTGIIGGDARSKSIASASILAKVIRDRIMRFYDKMYPQYGFGRHKGYPTSAHRAAVKKLGPSLIHRKSFSCV